MMKSGTYLVMHVSIVGDLFAKQIPNIPFTLCLPENEGATMFVRRRFANSLHKVWGTFFHHKSKPRMCMKEAE